MTPAEIRELHDDEYDALVAFMLDDARRTKRAGRR
jgi:hypothetical protein